MEYNILMGIEVIQTRLPFRLRVSSRVPTRSAARGDLIHLVPQTKNGDWHMRSVAEACLYPLFAEGFAVGEPFCL